jgi:hypothetical protein
MIHTEVTAVMLAIHVPVALSSSLATVTGVTPQVIA